jgi:hypothetical protein
MSATRECGEADTPPQFCMRPAKEAEGMIGRFATLAAAACAT